jgi:hypothetical protein
MDEMTYLPNKRNLKNGGLLSCYYSKLQQCKPDPTHLGNEKRTLFLPLEFSQLTPHKARLPSQNALMQSLTPPSFGGRVFAGRRIFRPFMRVSRRVD